MMSSINNNPWLSRVSKLCVFATLFLIFLGAIVTTYDAGMAAPNAPHVDGTFLNPKTPGTDIPWYKNPPLFKEHSHRLAAMTVGMGLGILTAMLWQNWTAFFVAVLFMGLGEVGRKFGVSNAVVAQLRVWPAMFIFIGLLIFGHKRRGMRITVDQGLVLGGYIAACVQAALGTLRVEIETAGNIALATNIRTFHGVFAQIFLALLVVIAARLSPVWKELGERPRNDSSGKIYRMATGLLVMYFFQLACAAYLRHRGLGLAIPTWPSAGQGMMPEQWTHAVGIHFLHTRLLPILITGHVIGLAITCAKRAAGEVRITRLGWTLLAFVCLQFLLGVLVIWKGRQPHVTNTHVMVGAFICGTTALLVARSWRLRPAE
jgi:heme A synthase